MTGIPDERTYIANMISNGTALLNIRVNAIHDEKMIRAIREGAKKRQINLLIQETTPAIKALADLPNMDIRQASTIEKVYFYGAKVSKSVVTEVRGGGGFSEWLGPPIWTKSAFKSTTTVYAASGGGPGETKTPTAGFDHDFALAKPLRRPHKRLPHRSVIPPSKGQPNTRAASLDLSVLWILPGSLCRWIDKCLISW